MENEFYSKTALDRVFDTLLDAQRLCGSTFKSSAVLDLIARHKDLEKNHIKSAFMAGRDFESNTSSIVYYEDSAEDYFNENHTICINTKQN
jgi:hypothetical protein